MNREKRVNLTNAQSVALRLAWLADRNPLHPALTIMGPLGYRASYSDAEGHVRTGCDLTRFQTIKALINNGTVTWIDTYTFHITEYGRFIADVYGFLE